MTQWPEDWTARMAGRDCPLCDLVRDPDPKQLVRILDGEFVRCLLRARGHDVLSPADGNLVQLVDVAARIRARVVVFLLGPGTQYDVALGAAAEIARGSRSAAVGVWSHADLPIAPSVTRISSMRELASLVRRS